MKLECLLLIETPVRYIFAKNEANVAFEVFTDGNVEYGHFIATATCSFQRTPRVWILIGCKVKDISKAKVSQGFSFHLANLFVTSFEFHKLLKVAHIDEASIIRICFSHIVREYPAN